MMDQKTETLDRILRPSEIDVGTPVEWMVDPDQSETILGVTYEFSQTGMRKTVWHTRNKRRATAVVVLTALAGG